MTLFFTIETSAFFHQTCLFLFPVSRSRYYNSYNRTEKAGKKTIDTTINNNLLVDFGI